MTTCSFELLPHAKVSVIILITFLFEFKTLHSMSNFMIGDIFAEVFKNARINCMCIGTNFFLRKTCIDLS